MQDEPTPVELLESVAQFLRETVMAETSGRTNFLTRVAANALDVVRRQLELAPLADREEIGRLEALLGRKGDLGELNCLLCERIERHEIDLKTPGLAEHLWHTTLAKLAVDQPQYAAYARAIEK
jgi:hypothetical protein